MDEEEIDEEASKFERRCRAATRITLVAKANSHGQHVLQVIETWSKDELVNYLQAHYIMEMQKHGRKAVRAQNVLGAVRLPEDPGTDVDFDTDEPEHANCKPSIEPTLINRNPNPRRPTGRRGKQ